MKTFKLGYFNNSNLIPALKQTLPYSSLINHLHFNQSIRLHKWYFIFQLFAVKSSNLLIEFFFLRSYLKFLTTNLYCFRIQSTIYWDS
jgi:hypothetical protein